MNIDAFKFLYTVFIFLMANRLIAMFLITTVANSLAKETFELPEIFEDLSNPSGQTEEMLEQFCSDLKNNTLAYKIKDFVKNVNRQWKILHPKKRPRRNEDCQETLNQIFVDCGIETEIETPLKQPAADNKTILVGVIDIRTLGQNNANFVIKLRYKKKACVALRQLLSYLEKDGFNKLYPNEKIILLALSFNDKVVGIDEWIALFCENGEIVDTRQDAACLYGKEFSDLKHRETPILEYFKNANETKSD